MSSPEVGCEVVSVRQDDTHEHAVVSA